MKKTRLWKKAMALTCAAACAATTLAGCGSKESAQKPAENSAAQSELRGRAAQLKDRLKLLLLYGIMRQQTIGKSW